VRDPRAIHRVITLDHLLRMRSGLAFPVAHADGRVTLGFPIGADRDPTRNKISFNVSRS
jgi:CubicO group peptidase (beta-lactamase class C family)